jgi:hypothetical protein
MQVKNAFLLFLITLLSVGHLFGNEENKEDVSIYLLPSNHPLQKQLKGLFTDPEMFEWPTYWNRAGFAVLDRVHRGFMVASHPLVKNYLFKKLQNSTPPSEQLSNYLRRIKGARALSKFIQDNHLKHIIVPQKWLYQLPKQFADPKTNESTYILIVEKIDLYSKAELPNQYAHIKKGHLKELCKVVYSFRGLDSVLHNMPFTHQQKIAFIDTERWERKREGFLHHVMPYLSHKKQAYARSVFQKLKKRNQN